MRALDESTRPTKTGGVDDSPLNPGTFLESGVAMKPSAECSRHRSPGQDADLFAQHRIGPTSLTLRLHLLARHPVCFLLAFVPPAGRRKLLRERLLSQ